MAYQVTNEDGGRTLLIRTALDLLNTVHPEDLSIREVARRAELSSGAPYHHFKTKTDLLAACAVVAWSDLCDQLEDDGANGPLDQLLERAKIYLAYARANPGPYQLITSRLFVDVERFPQIVELRARAMGGVIDLIVAARDPGMDRPTAKFLGVSMWSLLHGHLMLNNDSSGLLDSHATLDDEIARLATQMAQLPVPRPSFNQ
jgi:AcrR family transcriptional regulator